MPVEHFRSKEAERRNLAYRHMHGIPYTASRACVGRGKHVRCHEVEHSDSPKRRAIDARQRRKVARRNRRAEHHRSGARSTHTHSRSHRRSRR